MTTLAREIQCGDVIMPPRREVSLWMRRTCRERGLSDAAMYLSVTDVRDGTPDKGGPWLIVTADQTEEWNSGRRALPFRFKVRPATPWVMVARASVPA